MGTPGSPLSFAISPPHTFILFGVYLPAWLVHGARWGRLPHLVDTILAVSTGDSGCPGTFLSKQMYSSIYSTFWFLFVQELTVKIGC